VNLFGFSRFALNQPEISLRSNSSDCESGPLSRNPISGLENTKLLMRLAVRLGGYETKKHELTSEHVIL